MGIYINLDAMVHQINQEQWGKVYEETLILLQAYPFADRIVEKQGRGDWVYTQKAKERLLIPWSNEIGWCVIGDLESFRYAESFRLMRDIKYYQKTDKKVQNEQCDILKTLPNHEEISGRCVIGDSKTQGEPYHIYLLAIACLLENRLEGKVLVGGNVSKGQLKKACTWANQYLAEPIQIAIRGDERRLVERLATFQTDKREILECFFDSYIGEIGVESGEVLEQVVGIEVVGRYYLQRLKENKIGTIGFSRQAEEFLAWGFTVEQLIKVYKQLEGRTQEEDAYFVKAILKQDIRVNQPEQYDINDIEDLPKWREGSSVREGIKQTLEGIVTFVRERCEEESNFKGIEKLEGQDLLDQLIAYNQYLLLPKDFWDYVAQNIEDKRFVRIIMILFRIKAEERTIHRYLKYTLSNRPLFQTYIIKPLL